MIWFPKYVESYRNNAGWISFSVFSCFVFYSAAVFFKASWHRISYWTALTGLAALHVFLYLHIADIAAMKPGTFTIVSIFEVPALISVLYVAGFRDEENGGLTNRRGS